MFRCRQQSDIRAHIQSMHLFLRDATDLLCSIGVCGFDPTFADTVQMELCSREALAWGSRVV